MGRRLLDRWRCRACAQMVEVLADGTEQGHGPHVEPPPPDIPPPVPTPDVSVPAPPSPAPAGGPLFDP